MRHGIPLAGNFMQQELAIITGAVDAMVVDVQCIMQSMSEVANCYHTRLITTNYRAKIPGAEMVSGPTELHLPHDRPEGRGAYDRLIGDALRGEFCLPQPPAAGRQGPPGV